MESNYRKPDIETTRELVFDTPAIGYTLYFELCTRVYALPKKYRYREPYSRIFVEQSKTCPEHHNRLRRLFPIFRFYGEDDKKSHEKINSIRKG